MEIEKTIDFYLLIPLMLGGETSNPNKSDRTGI